MFLFCSSARTWITAEALWIQRNRQKKLQSFDTVAIWCLEHICHGGLRLLRPHGTPTLLCVQVYTLESRYADMTCNTWTSGQDGYTMGRRAWCYPVAVPHLHKKLFPMYSCLLLKFLLRRTTPWVRNDSFRGTVAITENLSPPQAVTNTSYGLKEDAMSCFKRSRFSVPPFSVWAVRQHLRRAPDVCVFKNYAFKENCCGKKKDFPLLQFCIKRTTAEKTIHAFSFFPSFCALIKTIQGRLGRGREKRFLKATNERMFARRRQVHFFPLYTINCSSPTERKATKKKRKEKKTPKRNPIFQSIRKGGGKEGVENKICSFPHLGTLNGLFFNSHVSLSLVSDGLVFSPLSKMPTCYFGRGREGGGGTQQIPALGEQASQAVTKLCHHLLQGVIFF